MTGVGNNRASTAGYEADANRKWIYNLPSVINVTAVDNTLHYAPYSNFGACITCSAPSGENAANCTAGIVTTDLSGAAGHNPNKSAILDNQDYTSGFTGTSAAAPIVSGCIALAEQAHNATFGNNLSGADVSRYYKHLLAETCSVVDSGNPSWITNAAGKSFSTDYGFGLVNADALTTAATVFSGVTELDTFSSGNIAVGARVYPNDPTGISRTCSILAEEGSKLEEVSLRLVMDEGNYLYEACYGRLEGILTSPSGTECALMISNPLGSRVYDGVTYDSVDLDWTFISNAYWGEDPTGTWTFTLSCPTSTTYNDKFYWTSFELTARCGDLVGVPEPGALALFGTGAAAIGVAGALRRRKES